MTAGTRLTEPVAAKAGGVLGNRDFVKLWTGESVSLVGTQITQLALPLVAVLTLHASVFQVGLLNASRYAPVVVFSLFAGVWLDRRRRRPVLVGADLACAAFIGLVPLCSVLGVLSIWVLCVAALLVGSAQVFFDIGALAYLPGLVERPHLAAANSKMQISYSVAGIGGPSLAGLLIGLLTAPITLSADAFSYLFSAVMLLTIRKPEPDPRGGGGQAAPPPPPWRAAVAEGLHTVFGNRMLRPLLAQSCMFNFCFNALLTVFVVYAIRRLGLSSFQLGCVIGAGAVAAFIGALVTTRATKALGLGRMLLVTLLGTCLAPLLLLVAGHTSPVSLLALGLSLAVSGICAVLYNIGTVTLRQVVTPNRLLARMNGTYRMLLFGASPLGALAGGALGSVAGLRPAMVIAALAMLSPTAWIPFSPVFRLKEMPAGPDDNAGTEEERSQAAELIEPGRKTDDVTEIIAVGRRPVLAGWEKSRRSGPGELPAEFTGGRPAALPDRQLLELRALLIGNSPRQLGFAPALWTREIIGELIRRRFGVILSGVTVGRILREQGMYPQGPLYRVYQQNTGKAREWREKTYPEIREEAARRGAEVFFADESPAEPPREPFACTDFRSVTTWGLTGPMPVVTATGERKPIMMVSAISSREELRFHLHEGTFRPADFIDFCRQLMQDIERDIFLIVEGISVHTSGETRAFVRSTGGKLRLFFLPAYSPELSPGGRARKNVMYDAIGRFDVRRADDPRAVALRAPKAAAETCVPIDSQDEY